MRNGSVCPFSLQIVIQPDLTERASVIAAVAVCPNPPLLVPEIAAGAAAELEVLRAACHDAIARMRGTGVEQIVVVGTDDGPVPGGLRGFGPGLAVDGAGDGRALPLSLLIGSWLLDRAGGGEPRVLFGVRPDGGPATSWPDLSRPTGLLVMADGSARRSVKAPGYLDERAQPFDAAVVKALAEADAETLANLDAALGLELLAAGVGALKALGALVGAAAGHEIWTAEVLYDDAPYGVQYTVASWVPAQAASRAASQAASQSASQATSP